MRATAEQHVELTHLWKGRTGSPSIDNDSHQRHGSLLAPLEDWSNSLWRQGMDGMCAHEDAEACRLFHGLIVPPPSAEDCANIVSGRKSRMSWSFVVHYESARDLCARLETPTFMTLSESMQTRILSLMDAGLTGGIYSVLRLRTGCESGPEHPSLLWLGCETGPRQPSLVWRLLGLLKALAAKSARDGGGQEVIRILARVIGMVCSARVEVDELKWILREVRTPSSITQPLLTALATMVPKDSNLADPRVVGAEPGRSCPVTVRSVFNFDGAGSGLVLPEMDWPFAQEYQIAFWLRVENSENARSETSTGRAHLLTLATNAGAGVDYYIESMLGVGSLLRDSCGHSSSAAGLYDDYILCSLLTQALPPVLQGLRLFVQVTDGRGGGQIPPKVVDLGEVGFLAGKWHALVIWHKRSSALLFNKDHLEVFLDERTAFSAPVPFPRNVTEPLARFSIGWDFDGQTSGVFLFSRGADLKVVGAMLRRYVGHLEGLSEPAAGRGSSPSDLDLCFDSATVSTQARLKTKLLGSKCVLLTALMPSRTINGLCLDPHNGHHAQLRGDRTHAWTVCTAQDVMRNIGGTPALLPLACYLLSHTTTFNREGSVTSYVSGANVDTVLSVLLSFLRGNMANQHDFFRVGGVEILELLLRSAPEENFALAGAHTVIVLEAIYLACGSHDATVVNVPKAPRLAENADSVDGGAPSLQHQVVFCLLSNFPLWARAPPAFQFGLANRLLDLVRENPTRFRYMISIEAILSSIHVCFSDNVPSALDDTLGDVEGLAVVMQALKMPSGEGVSGNLPQRPNEMDATKQDWTRMAHKERWHIRSCLWEVIRLLLAEYTSQENAVALVRFMASCDDARLVSELVQMLGSLMRQSTPPLGLFQALEQASQGFPPFGLGLRGTPASASSSRRPIGFLDLVLQRCVLADAPSESLRVAGLRVASVFMARFETRSEASVSSIGGGATKERRRGRDGGSGIGTADLEKLGKTMSAKALMRDRHLLGESTYGALLEMALLADEREVPWSEQVGVIGIVNAENCRRNQPTNNGVALDEETDARSERAVSDELAPSMWWNRQEAQDASDARGQQLILDDTQRIRNVLPLALILQHLPTMGGSVQVRSHRDLLLMLKLNEANRQKVVELSHVHGDRFWGVWERCLFLMMAPLFARRGDDMHKGLAKVRARSGEGTREGDYFMVLKLYAILLEHTMCFDEEGYKEIELATSLQVLIPHGRVAARVLLAQLAFKLGQRSSPPEILQRRSETTTEPSNGQADVGLQAFWNNMVHLAFVAANVVSDDVSTVAAGLFQEGGGLVRREDTLGHEGIRKSEDEARRASAAAATIPFLLCSSPAEHGSLALSARVLSMFEVLSWGSTPAVLKLCASCCRIPDQGPLLFPLLRMSLFLLVRLHPCSTTARENLSRLDALVHCLLSDEWKENAGKEFARSGDMCMVVLAHVHAALLRLKAQAATLAHVYHAAISDAVDSSAEETAPGFSVLNHTMSADNACSFSRSLLLLLQSVSQKRLGLLRKTLGERLTGALVDAVAVGLKSCTSSESASQSDNSDERGCYQGNLIQSVAWMDGSPLFSSTTDTAAGGTHGMSPLLEACMPSLKAAEELESRAVQAAGERSKGWYELASHAAAAVPTGDGHNEGSKEVMAAERTNRTSRSCAWAKEVVPALCEQAIKAKTLLAVKTKRRLLAARQRLQRCVSVFSAAWSPWAPGEEQPEGCQPPGWEISSHKDQLMRQMLLVPVDKDVRHLDASYNGSNTSNQHARRKSRREDGMQDSALLAVPALKPSASLLAGDVVVDDEDEEEIGGKDEGESDQSDVSTFVQDLELASRDSEDGVGASAFPIESEATVHKIANQQASDVLQPQSIAGSPSERTFQPTRGTWKITMVLRECSVPGSLYLFADTLVFRSDSDGSEDGNEPFLSGTRYCGRTWRWRLERLTQLHLRRFLLRPQAAELFWADSPEVFLAFPDVDKRQQFTHALRKQNLPMLPITTRNGILHPRKVLKATRLTEQWRRRQISNFQYIMELNVVAGRSYNDITQYPVFPWVLSDYTSNELDLENPASFRDLRKPLGALNDERRKAFEERYATFEDDLVPKFMYGSHYSSAGIILHYLVRQEPFSTLHINLQDGRFDCPDRLFYDIKQCWSGCIDVNNMSDVKELTPEFFYCPEIFLNSNKLPLGQPQAGGVVNDVNLPPWAKDAYDFVRLHRLALESEQVSQHLQHWIDLVFGCKQRGYEAVKAANVFYYLTYEGAVDLSQVNDSRQREAMETQIRHFGQTPSQLFLEPHPVRLPPEECVLPLFSSASSLHSLRVYSPRNWQRDVDNSAALLVYCTEDRLVCVDATLRVTTWTWSGLPNGKGQPFTLGARRSTRLPSRLLHMSKAGAKSPALLKKMASMPSSRSNTPDVSLAPASEIRSFSQMGSQWFSGLKASFSESTSPQEPVSFPGHVGYSVVSTVPSRDIGRVHSCFGLRTAFDGNPDSILSCGYWDHAIRRHSLDSSCQLVLGDLGTGGHEGAVNCLSIADGGSLLVTGSQDATCRVWVVANAPMALALGGGDSAQTAEWAPGGENMVCVHILYGHEAPVTCLAVSEELDATVSGASDGRIVLHCLKDGRYVRQFFCPRDVAADSSVPAPEVSQLAFSCHGDVMVHSWVDRSIHRFSLNGARLASTVVPTPMSCLLTSGGGEYLLGGGEDGLIRVYTLHNLCEVHTVDLQDHGGVTCMRMSAKKQYLLAGSEDGEVSIITDAKTRLRMLDIALRKAFIG